MNNKPTHLRRLVLRLALCLIALVLTLPAEASKRKNRNSNDSIAVADTTVNPYNDSLLYAARHIDSIINFGRRFIGTPYRYGGSTPGGFDCSGFTMFIFGKYGHILPHKGSSQYLATVPVRTENATRGDLIYFEGRSHNRQVGHVGVITEKLPDGSFNFLHSSTSRGVIIDNTKQDYYARRFLKVSRVVPPFRRSPGEMLFVQGVDSTFNSNDSIVIVYEKQTVTEPAKYHTVKAGETLSSISRKYGTTVANLQKMNKLNGDFLAEHQRLKVRNSYTKTIEVAVPKRISELPQGDDEDGDDSIVEESNTATTKATTAAHEDVIKHTVQAGETLTALARIYKTSVAEIQRLNGLTTSNIHAGDVLIVKEEKPQTEKSAEATAQTTKPSESDTKLGEKQVEPQPTPEQQVAETPKPQPAPTTYTVRQGDTLWKIAKAHNTTPEALMKLNQLENDHLAIGQKLKLR